MLAASALLALPAMWWMFSQPYQPGAALRSGIALVRTSLVQSGDMPVIEAGLGSVVPLATVTVRPQVSGPLTQVNFREGQDIHKGDLIATIDPRPFAIALRLAQGQLARDLAKLETAKIDLARYTTLKKQDSIARQQVDAQLSLVQQYQGIVESDQAAVDNADLNLDYTRLTAPIDGRIGLRAVDVGNYVQTADPAGLAVITQLRPISVVFTLPEDDLPAILRQRSQGKSLPVIAYDRSDRHPIARGTLQAVDSQIDPSTATVRLRAAFTNEDGALYPNQFVNAHIIVDTRRGVAIVPQDAVQSGPAGDYVWRIASDGRAEMRPVRLGPEEGGRVAVLEGLAAGDRVVTDGVDRLRAGAVVRFRDSGATP